MNHFPSVRLALSLALALSACNTEEIAAPHQVAIEKTPSDAAQGALLIFFTPTDATYEAEQARLSTHPNLAPYHLYVDGREVVYDDGQGTVYPVVVNEGTSGYASYWPEGIHHFELAAADGPTIFAGDGPIVAGAVTRLYLFGPLGALQGRFTSYAFAPPDGSLHASVINLLRDGRRIELVSCTDTSHCTAVSPALALGDTFEGDFPIVAPDDSFTSLSATGAGVGYRLVPSASLPAPPVLPLRWSIFSEGFPQTQAPWDLVAAPIYMSPDGSAQSFWF